MGVEDPDDDPETVTSPTIGSMIRVSVTARSGSPPGSPKGRMRSGAIRIRTAVSAETPMRTSQKIVEATRQARAFSSLASSSLKTGTNAPESAASPTNARVRLGICDATVKALIFPETPKKYAATISRTRPRTRERPVARVNVAVERASRRAWPPSLIRASIRA